MWFGFCVPCLRFGMPSLCQGWERWPHWVDGLAHPIGVQRGTRGRFAFVAGPAPAGPGVPLTAGTGVPPTGGRVPRTAAQGVPLKARGEAFLRVPLRPRPVSILVLASEP